MSFNKKAKIYILLGDAVHDFIQKETTKKNGFNKKHVWLEQKLIIYTEQGLLNRNVLHACCTTVVHTVLYKHFMHTVYTVFADFPPGVYGLKL